MVKRLLDAGAHVDVEDMGMETALQIAVREGHNECVQLLEAGVLHKGAR